jgi:hypothetical protein
MLRPLTPLKSETLLATAKKDLGDVVVQAQKEFGKLTQASEESTSEDSSALVGEESKTNEAQPPESKESDNSLSSSEVTDHGAPSSPLQSQSIFARLHQAIPPNIISTVQKNIPESLKQASEHIDIAHLKSEFQRVQGVTRAHAEEYVHKSEVLFREAMKEAGEVLKDVVKVVPPDQADNLPGVMWDGTDIWMLPTDYGRRPSEAKGKDKESTPTSARLAVASRAEALLRKLKSDPEIIAHDTEEGSEVKALFEEWLKEHVDSKEGIEGPEWKAKVEQALADPFDGSVLQATYDALGTFMSHLDCYSRLHSVLKCLRNWTRRFSGSDISSVYIRLRKLKKGEEVYWKVRSVV